MKRVASVLIASLLLTRAWPSPAAADSFTDSFTVTTIDVPGSSSTTARGINDAGQIVGDFVDATGGHGFLLSGGNFTTIDVPGSSSTTARGINDAGQIVGDALGQGFLLSGGNFTTFRAPLQTTAASGINDAGQIVGFSFFVPFPVHGFLLSGGSFTTISVPGSSHTTARGINDAGQIVGDFVDATGSHGFLLSGGHFTTIDFPGSTATQAFGINNAGQIVGSVSGGDFAFLLSGGNFTTIDFPGSAVTEAWGINDAGQIVGHFAVAGVGHGFLATPVPEPGTFILLGLGLLGLTVRNRRARPDNAAAGELSSSVRWLASGPPPPTRPQPPSPRGDSTLLRR